MTADEETPRDGLEPGVEPTPDLADSDRASGDPWTTDLGEVPTVRRAPSPWIRGAAVLALVVAVGAAVAVARDRGAETAPADGAEVVARAGRCLSLTIEDDGWRFKNRRPDLATDLPIGAPIGEDPAPTPPGPAEPPVDRFGGWGYPARWHGDHIAGRIYVDGPIPGSDQGGVDARFVADDGTEISMYGHPPGAEVFEQLSCAIVADPSVAITDRYAELAADGPLPPVVGPALDQPSGFQYAGMRATGSGADRSIVLRFERPAQEAIPDAYQCIDGLPPDAPERDGGCGPTEDRPAAMVLVCVTTGNGCQPGPGEVRLEVASEPPLDNARTYLLGPQDAIDQWSDVEFTSDLTLMGWPM